MLYMALVFYVVMVIAGLFMPQSSIKFWIITISYMFTNLGQYAYYLVMTISSINTVE